jgi:hypothetical protein
MFVGHYGPSFAAKAFKRPIPLWVLFLAVQLLDVFWSATSTIDHIAFEIPLTDFADERKRLEALGLQVETAEHAWVRWRSLYVTDPEGNQVELVCYDGSV